MLRLADVHTTQLNDPTSGLDALNCTCGVGATACRWHYRNVAPTLDPAFVWPPTAGRVRDKVLERGADVPDVLGGTSLRQVALALLTAWGVPMTVVDDGRFDDAWDLGSDPEVFVALGIQYDALDGTPFDAGGSFLGAHATGFANASANLCDFTDPLADGRRAGIPNGVQRMPRALLRTAAGRLVVGSSGARVGLGGAWYGWVRAVPLPATTVHTGGDVMFNVGPITTERDAIVSGSPARPVILYRDAALTERQSSVSKPTPLGFLGSTAEAHVVVNAGMTNYVARVDVARIIANRRSFQ